MNNILSKYIKRNLAFALVLTVYGCEIINPEESIPAIIEIEELKVEAIEDQEGSSFQEITDIWVFVNPEGSEGSDLLGIFPLPATIPILEEGMTSINIQAGVKLNNQNVNRSVYSLFRSDQRIIDLKAGETIQLVPVFSYKPPAQIRFDFINDFESSNDFVSLTSNIQLELTSDENLVFEGDKSLTLQLDTINTGFVITTINSFRVQKDRNDVNDELPVDERDTYLEMHYKNDATLFVSVFINSETIPVNILRIGAKSEWSKIYIPLKDALITANTTSDNPTINIAFEGFLSDGLTTACFSWDNIKIVHELL